MAEEKIIYMPKLSVIVPVFNIEQYIEHCLESITRQTFHDFELIVIDDGSTDLSGTICDMLSKSDARIKVFHQANCGLVAARKRGMSIATGAYIANVDGDDWIEATLFEKAITVLEKEKADYIQFGYREEYEDHSQEQLFPKVNYCALEKKEQILCDWLDKGSLSGLGSQVVTKICRSNIFISAYSKVPDNMSNGEDYVFFLNLLQEASSFSSMSDSFYHYRIRNNSLSHKTGIDLLLKENALTLYIDEMVKKFNGSDALNSIERWKISRTVKCFSSLFCSLLGDDFYMTKYIFGIIPQIRNKDVILYGAGKVGKECFIRLLLYEDVHLLAWVDSNSMEKRLIYDIEPVESIKDKDFDAVIVAIKKEDIFVSIKKELMDLGIPDSKILWAKPREIIDKYLEG